jgi:hypothetical protein
MRLPSQLLHPAAFRCQPVLAAMAAVAFGMFVGGWVIGPAITRDSIEPSAQRPQGQPSFDEMLARPDPMPYRAPTPTFAGSGPPSYAAAAKEKAQAELGGLPRGDGTVLNTAGIDRSYSRDYQSFDRHRVD